MEIKKKKQNSLQIVGLFNSPFALAFLGYEGGFSLHFQ